MDCIIIRHYFLLSGYLDLYYVMYISIIWMHLSCFVEFIYDHNGVYL